MSNDINLLSKPPTHLDYSLTGEEASRGEESAHFDQLPDQGNRP